MKALTTEEFIRKAKEIHGDKYDYSLVDYKNNHTKIKIICPIHGEFEQIPQNHLKEQGCPECATLRKTSNKETFIKKAKEIHGDKYDYSLVEYKNCETKVKIICPEHGVFEQRPMEHLSKKGCRRCGYEKNIKNSSITTEEFVQRAKEIHGNKYDYSLVDKNIKAHKNVKIICPIHGEFEQSVWNHLCGHGCSICSKKVYSKGEKNIRSFLLNNNIDFQQQKTFEDLKDKNKLSYDFYIPSKNLLIEYQGEQHYKKSSFKHHDLKMQRHHDWLKRKYAKKNNIELLTIPYWNFKIINEILKEKLDVGIRGEADIL